jgi:ABC-type multidrug transport system ATPase subunit
MLQITNLKFQYPKSDFSLQIDDLSFKKGEITALVGGNGCGKTTLFRLLSGVYDPEEPCFSYNNGVIKSELSDLNCTIVMHNAFGGISPRLTVLQNAQFVARLYGSDSSVANITALAESIGFVEYLHKKPPTLSAGQSRKALLLRTLASDPDIILLDEPTTALDVVGIELTLDWMKKLSEEHGKTVIVSTHNLYELAMLRPNIIGLRDGRVVNDISSSEDISSPEKARDLIHTIIGLPHEY